MKSLIALAFMLAVSVQAQTTQTADCTVNPGCRLVTDRVFSAVIGYDVCDIWSGGNKAYTSKYFGGQVKDSKGVIHDVGCLWYAVIPDGETWWISADVVRGDWSGYSPSSQILILTSKKGWVEPPLPPLLPPQNLRLANSCDGLLDLLLRDSGLLFDTLYT